MKKNKIILTIFVGLFGIIIIIASYTSISLYKKNIADDKETFPSTENIVEVKKPLQTPAEAFKTDSRTKLLDKEDYEYISYNYYKYNEGIYYRWHNQGSSGVDGELYLEELKLVEGTDPLSFLPLADYLPWAVDKDHVYYRENMVKEIDRETFQPMSVYGDFAKDKNDVYFYTKKLGISPKDFKIVFGTEFIALDFQDYVKNEDGYYRLTYFGKPKMEKLDIPLGEEKVYACYDMSKEYKSNCNFLSSNNSNLYFFTYNHPNGHEINTNDIGNQQILSIEAVKEEKGLDTVFIIKTEKSEYNFIWLHDQSTYEITKI